MFDHIAPRYDFLNHLLSANIDKIWRRKVRRLLEQERPRSILDVATGTGDLAIELARLQPERIIGVDISANMLELGKRKIQARHLDGLITFQKADSENLPFADNSFDAVTVAFGVRNFENLEAGLAEMTRVLKPGCRLVVLEFSKPSVFPFRELFNLYFHYILPAIGRFFSRDRRAYSYLPESVKAFPEGQKFMSLLQAAGINHVKCISLTFGIASVYTGTKS
ncbi:MAG: demethylmenaquinone methyltransferase [Chitinophagales bacterium]|nr:MAG: demethylmenaquinone methyltransferase [Chitinophagales bacterium]